MIWLYKDQTRLSNSWIVLEVIHQLIYIYKFVFYIFYLYTRESLWCIKFSVLVISILSTQKYKHIIKIFNNL